MVHTLEALKSGALVGTKRLKLACGLTEFPEEILSLADTLEVLDLSDNAMSILPDSISQLKKLKIIFFAKNNFTVFPAVLAKCPALSMIGFKSNAITTVPEQAFPPLLRWLILTDNKIEVLPKSIGHYHLLQKCALAGNRIKALPAEMAHCLNLELLRLSANALQSIPDWLFELPRLSWVAFGGNPATYTPKSKSAISTFDWDDFAIDTLLGEGASGFISKAHWISKSKDVAIKIFKGAVTSDGLPEDEMKASILAGAHPNLIPVLGKISKHPEAKNGLVLKLIGTSFKNLGNPPSLESCTRDVFDATSSFSHADILKIAKSIAAVAQQLHQKGINHGDLYAHNILVDTTADCLLGDFGAASFYDTNTPIAHNIERIEVNAYGCLLEDLLEQSDLSEALQHKWQALIANCTAKTVSTRPGFSDIVNTLKAF